ncbi:MAG: cation-translocating P-type ATPase C-terminal domain-containing protein [Anaerolineales bacterium]
MDWLSDPQAWIAFVTLVTLELVLGVAITAACLTAYGLGLAMHPEPAGVFNTTAATMAFVTLSFSELFRAFTARSERYPLLRIGIFSNRNMTYAVMASAVLLLAVIYVPFMNEIFDTIPLDWSHWQYVLPLLFVPSLVAEITKAIVTRQLSRRALQPA